MHEADIVKALRASETGLTVSQLVGAVGASSSQVRLNLGRLAAAGMVTSAPVRSSRPGRPSSRYQIADTTDVWTQVAPALVGVVVELDDDSLTALIDAGREFGRQGAKGVSPETLIAEVARLGFAPQVCSNQADEAAGVTRVRMDNCPLRDCIEATAKRPLCVFHHAALDGASAASGCALTELHVADPLLHRCEFAITRD